MKKHLITCLALLLLAIILCGCLDKQPAQSMDNSGADITMFDKLQTLANNGKLNENDINYSLMSEEEYNVRVVINAGSMYNDLTEQGYETEISFISKYGIDDFAQYDSMYPFYTLEDMETVFKNPDFLEDYYHQYGFNLDIDSYYILPDSVREQYAQELLTISLIVLDGGHHFRIHGGNSNGDAYICWGAFNVQKRVTLDMIAEFYADKDSLQLSNANRSNGSVVYYMSSEKNCTLFTDMGLTTNKMTTAYLWEQDGVIGVLILQGEHKDENLDLCVLEKHEI